VLTEQLDERLLRCVAPNGLRVLTEALPGVRSAALGIWVRSASVHESPERMGVSHLLEHMVFKGTERRTPYQIALELESRGGSLDAFTSRDHTTYQAHVLDADLPVAVDVLTDLVRRPLLRQSDLDLERNVILEEINSVQDAPDDLVFELHARALWPSHPYGYSILGTAETVGSINSDDLLAAHLGGYYPGNCIIAAAGNIEHDQLMAALEREGASEGTRRRSRDPRSRRCAASDDVPRRASSATWSSVRMRCPAAIPAATCSPSYRRYSAAGCRAGSSKRCARSWGSGRPEVRCSQRTASGHERPRS
jgi:predicted Zn-dependent peptidase